MRAIEVHVIETDDDVNLAMSSGLLELEDLEHLYCDECEENVGRVDGVFEEFSVVLYEDDASWFVCSSCSAPITERDSFLEVELEFDGFVEGIEGMLEATFKESKFDDYDN